LIDLKNGYWYVPIQRSFHNHLGFTIKETKYQFKGVNLHIYLDDWLIWTSSEEECRVAFKVSLAVIQDKGFLIN